jgi:Flp pilus assembly protein TadD
MHISQLGKHKEAIDILQEDLVKVPDAAPYIHSLLGEEYLETRQLPEAVTSFQEAVRVMPREAATHSNLGLSLALSGELELAEKELRKALELDHGNDKAKTILDAVLVAERTPLTSAP